MTDLMALPWWAFAVIAGPVLLGAAIAWGLMRNRSRTSRERALTEAGAHDLYAEEDADRR